MPFPIRHLMEDRHKVVTVSLNQPVRLALELMTEHGFSQLPVVDGERRPLGMITTHTILEALKQFGVTIDVLQVADAMTIKVAKFSPEDDLFDMLEALKKAYAVLIVDGERRLAGIVTNYDTAEFFRQRAEDLMLVQDIETAIKDHILAAFTDETGQLNEQALSAAICEVLPGPKHLNRGRFRHALNHYAKRAFGDKQHNPDDDLLEEALSRLYGEDEPKSFDQLTLAEYIQLFSHKDQWLRYGSVFNLDRKVVYQMLNSVREIRNALAHFHGDIPPEQRHQLCFCAEWLTRHEPATPKMQPEPDLLGQTAASLVDAEIIPTDEEVGLKESRYAPLALWLQNQPTDQDRQRLTFVQIEQIIGDKLPPSAHQHRSWWANDPVGHVQSQQWLSVGWRAYVNMSKEEVTFVRVKEREKAYIDFFSALLAELRAKASFTIKDHSPQGNYWHVVASLPEGGPQQAILDFSFARGEKFRVELYIDTGEKGKNKGVFDALHAQKSEIEATLGDALAWERIDDRRASRIALYRGGAITDSDEELAKLRTWAVDAMVRFRTAIWNKANVALKAI